MAKDIVQRLREPWFTNGCEAYQRDAADLIERLRSAARDVVLAYQEANPMRTADMHPARCGCLRCEIDRLDHVSGEST